MTSPRISPSSDERAVANLMRRLGFADGVQGRPKGHDHPEYRASYRRGAERRRATRKEK